MADTIKIADSVRFGRYKHHLMNANRIAELIAQALPKARKILNLPQEVEVVIRPMNVKFGGQYRVSQRQVEINVRRTELGKILCTLMHELVHAEQFHEGRLRHEVGCFSWNGEMVFNRGKTMKQYLAQPWEQEAFAREYPLAKEVAKMIAEDNGVKNGIA